MTLVRFCAPDGRVTREVEAQPGASLLDVAQEADQPLEGTCEGQMACSTCHVIIDPDDFAKLPRAAEAEEDMLDFAANVTRTSRLSCQIWLTEDLESLTVRMPGASHNMMDR